MKILLKRLLLVTPAQYIVFSLWINLLDFVDKEGVTNLHPRCSRKRAMSEIGVDKIENMGREALIFLWKELFTEPIASRTSVSFLRHVLAFEVQCRRNSLPSSL